MLLPCCRQQCCLPLCSPCTWEACVGFGEGSSCTSASTPTTGVDLCSILGQRLPSLHVRYEPET